MVASAAGAAMLTIATVPANNANERRLITRSRVVATVDHMTRRFVVLAVLLTVTSACGSSSEVSGAAESLPASTLAVTTTAPSTTTSQASTTTTIPGLADDRRITPVADLADPDACKIADITGGGFSNLVTSGFPLPPSAPDALRDFRLLVIPFSVSDSVFDDTDLAIVEEMLDFVNRFFSDQSYGKATIIGTVAPRDSWVTLPGTANSTGMSNMTFAHDKTSIFRDVVNEAAATLDLTAYDAVAVYSHKDDRFYFGQGNLRVDTPNGEVVGILMGGQNVILWSVLAHELGHTWLSSEDLYYFPDQSQIMLGGWGLMAESVDLTLELTPWLRWINGWIDDTQVRCITSPGESIHHLEMISAASNAPKMVVVALSDHSALVVDSRREFEFGEGSWDVNGDATIVYVVDTSIPHGQGPIRWRGEMRSIGESVTTDGVTVTLLDSDDTNDLVSVVVT